MVSQEVLDDIKEQLRTETNPSRRRNLVVSLSKMSPPPEGFFFDIQGAIRPLPEGPTGRATDVIYETTGNITFIFPKAPPPPPEPPPAPPAPPEPPPPPTAPPPPSPEEPKKAFSNRVLSGLITLETQIKRGGGIDPNFFKTLKALVSAEGAKTQEQFLEFKESDQFLFSASALFDETFTPEIRPGPPTLEEEKELAERMAEEDEVIPTFTERPETPARGFTPSFIQGDDISEPSKELPPAFTPGPISPAFGFTPAGGGILTPLEDLQEPAEIPILTPLGLDITPKTPPLNIFPGTIEKADPFRFTPPARGPATARELISSSLIVGGVSSTVAAFTSISTGQPAAFPFVKMATVGAIAGFTGKAAAVETERITGQPFLGAVTEIVATVGLIGGLQKAITIPALPFGKAAAAPISARLITGQRGSAALQTRTITNLIQTPRFKTIKLVPSKLLAQAKTLANTLTRSGILRRPHAIKTPPLPFGQAIPGGPGGLGIKLPTSRLAKPFIASIDQRFLAATSTGIKSLVGTLFGKEIVVKPARVDLSKFVAKQTKTDTLVQKEIKLSRAGEVSIRTPTAVARLSIPIPLTLTKTKVGEIQTQKTALLTGTLEKEKVGTIPQLDLKAGTLIQEKVIAPERVRRRFTGGISATRVEPDIKVDIGVIPDILVSTAPEIVQPQRSTPQPTKQKEIPVIPITLPTSVPINIQPPPIPPPRPFIQPVIPPPIKEPKPPPPQPLTKPVVIPRFPIDLPPVKKKKKKKKRVTRGVAGFREIELGTIEANVKATERAIAGAFKDTGSVNLFKEIKNKGRRKNKDDFSLKLPKIRTF